VDVVLAFPFTDQKGAVRNFTLVVCEIVPYLPVAQYNRKVLRSLPTYQQVSVYYQQVSVYYQQVNIYYIH